MPGVRFHKKYSSNGVYRNAMYDAIVLHLEAITDYSLADLFYHRENGNKKPRPLPGFQVNT